MQCFVSLRSRVRRENRFRAAISRLNVNGEQQPAYFTYSSALSGPTSESDRSREEQKYMDCELMRTTHNMGFFQQTTVLARHRQIVFGDQYRRAGRKDGEVTRHSILHLLILGSDKGLFVLMLVVVFSSKARLGEGFRGRIIDASTAGTAAATNDRRWVDRFEVLFLRA